jgi:hypothetical protein
MLQGDAGTGTLSDEQWSGDHETLERRIPSRLERLRRSARSSPTLSRARASPPIGQEPAGTATTNARSVGRSSRPGARREIANAESRARTAQLLAVMGRVRSRRPLLGGCWWARTQRHPSSGRGSRNDAPPELRSSLSTVTRPCHSRGRSARTTAVARRGHQRGRATGGDPAAHPSAATRSARRGRRRPARAQLTP